MAGSTVGEGDGELLSLRNRNNARVEGTGTRLKNRNTLLRVQSRRGGNNLSPSKGLSPSGSAVSSRKTRKKKSKRATLEMEDQETRVMGGTSSTRNPRHGRRMSLDNTLEIMSVMNSEQKGREQEPEAKGCCARAQVWFLHPYARLFCAWGIILMNFLMFAEDPVAHSVVEADIPVIGHCYAMVATNFPGDSFPFWTKIVTASVCVLLGLVLSRQVVHHVILRDWRKISMFEENKGTWMVMFLANFLALYGAALLFNVMIGIVDWDPSWKVTGEMGFSWTFFAKLAATGTWLGDFVTAAMVTDMLLQSRETYPSWAVCGRKVWNEGCCGLFRVVTFWVVFLGGTGAFFYVIFNPHIFDWDDMNFTALTSSELSRAWLAGIITLFDLLIVMQDWEFPWFANEFEIKLPGTVVETIEWDCCSMCPKFFDVIITGKWFNYGIIVIVMMLDMNMYKNQVLYAPSEYAQYTDSNGFIYTVMDPTDATAALADPDSFTRALRMNSTTDERLNSQYLEYGVVMMATSLIPIAVGFLLMFWLVHRDEPLARRGPSPKRPRIEATDELAAMLNSVQIDRPTPSPVLMENIRRSTNNSDAPDGDEEGTILNKMTDARASRRQSKRQAKRNSALANELVLDELKRTEGQPIIQPSTPRRVLPVRTEQRRSNSKSENGSMLKVVVADTSGLVLGSKTKKGPHTRRTSTGDSDSSASTTSRPMTPPTATKSNNNNNNSSTSKTTNNNTVVPSPQPGHHRRGSSHVILPPLPQSRPSSASVRDPLPRMADPFAAMRAPAPAAVGEESSVYHDDEDGEATVSHPPPVLDSFVTPSKAPVPPRVVVQVTPVQMAEFETASSPQEQQQFAPPLTPVSSAAVAPAPSVVPRNAYIPSTPEGLREQRGSITIFTQPRRELTPQRSSGKSQMSITSGRKGQSPTLTNRRMSPKVVLTPRSLKAELDHPSAFGATQMGSDETPVSPPASVNPALASAASAADAEVEALVNGSDDDDDDDDGSGFYAGEPRRSLIVITPTRGRRSRGSGGSKGSKGSRRGSAAHLSPVARKRKKIVLIPKVEQPLEGKEGDGESK